MQQGLWALSDTELRARLDHARDDLEYAGVKLAKLETALDLLKHRLTDAAADGDVERCKHVQSLINTTRREIGSLNINVRILNAVVQGVQDEQLVRNPPRNPIGRNRHNPNQQEGFWARLDREVRNAKK